MNHAMSSELAAIAARCGRALAAPKPTGRLVLVEYRGEDPGLSIAPRHRMTERQVLAEIQPMGFRHPETIGILPRQHIIVFAKQVH